MFTINAVYCHLKVRRQISRCYIPCLRSKYSFCINVVCWSLLLLIIVFKRHYMNKFLIDDIIASNIFDNGFLSYHINNFIFCRSEFFDYIIIFLLSYISILKPSIKLCLNTIFSIEVFKSMV